VSFDTKYRPPTYEGVLGQEGTIKILREFVRQGKARQQSYLFAGPYGSGKTTLGRILARALLCSAPTPEGDPCDQCSSCNSLLTLGTAEGYVEVDAATNSGKDQMRKVVEEIQFSTFSGRHRIYLFDESHQLSKEALDAILKPLEENTPGSTDKQLVCIFCTTEPEKMRATILSRCAPAFVVRPVAPEKIAARLAMVCQKEGIEYDLDQLKLVAEMTECHIRDALKALEGIAMLGPVNRDNVAAYLHLDLNGFYFDILENLGRDIAKVMSALTALLERRSPATCYERLSEEAMRSYQVALEAIRVEAYRDVPRLKALASQHGDNLLALATRFSERPARASAAALKLDLLQLHAQMSTGQGLVISSPPVNVPALVPVSVQVASAPVALPVSPSPASPSPSVAASGVSSPLNGGRLDPPTSHVESEFKFSEKAKKRKPAPASEPSPSEGSSEFNTTEFCWLLARRVRELSEGALGPARHPNVDSP
jgi:DNA polymerase III subunit gamma/tau